MACSRSTSPTATKASRPGRSPSSARPELDRYLDANVEAVREVADRVAPDVALANHLVMGPADPRPRPRPARCPTPSVVHGSALEYTVKPHPRFLPYAHEGIERRPLRCSSAPATPRRASGRPSTTPRCPRGRASAPRRGHRDVPGPRTRRRGRGPAAARRAPADPSQPGTDTSFQRDTAAAARSLGPAAPRPGPHRAVPRQGDPVQRPRPAARRVAARAPAAARRAPGRHRVRHLAHHGGADDRSAGRGRPRRGARDRRRGPRRRGRPARPAAPPARVPRRAGGR